MSERVCFVAEHRDEHGVEPICRALEDTLGQIAPSMFYAAQSRPPLDRSIRDEELLLMIGKIHHDNYGGCGVLKVHAQLRRQGEKAAESTVRWLMRAAGSRARGPRTTKPVLETGHQFELVNLEFVASRPNELGVVDIPYVFTFSAWVYVLFVTDVFNCLLGGRQVSTHL